MPRTASPTERHPAERKLRAARRALADVVRLTGAGAVAIDPDRAATEAHERAVQELQRNGGRP